MVVGVVLFEFRSENDEEWKMEIVVRNDGKEMGIKVKGNQKIGLGRKCWV